jgi:hypothetical protein
MVAMQLLTVVVVAAAMFFAEHAMFRLHCSAQVLSAGYDPASGLPYQTFLYPAPIVNLQGDLPSDDVTAMGWMTFADSDRNCGKCSKGRDGRIVCLPFATCTPRSLWNPIGFAAKGSSSTGTFQFSNPCCYGQISSLGKLNCINLSSSVRQHAACANLSENRREKMNHERSR